MYPVPTEAATQGRTDQYIGSWLAQNKSRRGNVILATKVSGASERITWVRDSGKARTREGHTHTHAGLRARMREKNGH
jgi:aryl-alcohol dehydrogenase-like predicted oxidoreductase